jgi:ABC-2 type transport system ATP-binding protein
MTPPPAVLVRDVTKRYPVARPFSRAVRRPWQREWKDALRGVSLDVPERTVHGLLGANGAGKTSLLKILATLVAPTSGRIQVAGHDVVREADRVRRVLGLVINEERSFYWRLSGRENLAFFAALHDLAGAEARRQVDVLLDVVGLTGDAHRAFREYSSGMRQRLAIARGLLCEPRVLLLDEPTRALDPPSARWIRRFVREHLVAERGATVLLATHDLLEAETTCDRLSLVDDGRIVACGTVAELARPLAAAGHARVELADGGGDLAARVGAGWPDAEARVLERTPRLCLEMPGDPERVASAVRALVEAGGRVCEVRPVETPLSTLFERVAGRDGPARSLAAGHLGGHDSAGHLGGHDSAGADRAETARRGGETGS